MTLTTTTEVRGSSYDLHHGQLVVRVFDGETELHSFVLASGPRADLEDLNAGTCTLDELHARWVKMSERKSGVP